MRSLLIAVVALAASPAFAAADLVLTTFDQPCRVIDTRLGGGPLAPTFERSFKIAGTTGFTPQGGNSTGCGVPTSALAVSINFVAVNPQAAGNLRASAYPIDVPTTGSIINYSALNPNLNIANELSFPICDHSQPAPCDYDITVEANGGGVHLVADVLGYFTADHKHSGEDITSGTVSEARIDSALARDSEVLSIVLGGDGTGSGLDADLFDGNDSAAFAGASHNHDGTYEKKYRRTVIVNSGGTDLENGTTLLNALAGITTASATNPFLLKLEPGTYHLLNASLVMKPFVDIEGSGEDHTVIRSGAIFVVDAKDDVEIRSLTIAQDTGTPGAIAIRALHASPRISSVKLIANGNGSQAFAGVDSSATFRNVTASATGLTNSINYAIFNLDTDASPDNMVLENVTATADGIIGSSEAITLIDLATIKMRNVHAEAVSGASSAGIKLSAGTAVLENVEASGVKGATFFNVTGATSSFSIANCRFFGSAKGMSISGNQPITATMTGLTTSGPSHGLEVNMDPGVTGNLIVTHSRIQGGVFTVQASADATVRIGASELSGGSIAGAAVTCAGNFDELYTFFPSTCP